jgi:hypothetical protein
MEIKLSRIAATKAAVSKPVAEEARRKLALEKEQGPTKAPDRRDPRRFRERKPSLGRRSVSGTDRDCIGDEVSLSMMPTTFIISVPMRVCKARTVGRCSEGYSMSRKRTSGCVARYVSRCGMIRAASRARSAKGLLCVCFVNGCAVNACIALAMRYLFTLAPEFT